MIQGTYYKEWSRMLGRDMEFKVYGHAGTPVLAYGRGGACETVLPGKTGYWFEEQTADSLAACIQRFEKDGVAYRKEEIREHSRAFSEERFEREIKEYCTRRMADWQQELLDCSHWEKEELD